MKKGESCELKRKKQKEGIRCREFRQEQLRARHLADCEQFHFHRDRRRAGHFGESVEDYHACVRPPCTRRAIARARTLARK